MPMQPKRSRVRKASSSRACIGARPGRPSGRPGEVIGLAARRGQSLIGMAVVDPDGIELGYVSAEEENFLVLGEGSAGLLRLGRRYIGGLGESVTLKGPLVEILAGLNVVDNEGDFVGVVRDTVEGEDVLDSLIVEDEQGEMVTVVMEDVRSIDEWVELKVSGEELEGT